MLPAAATVPPTEPDALWSAQVGGEQIIRAADRAYVSDPALDPLIAAGRDIAPLDPDVMREALLLSLAAPPLDLLSGAWRPKRRWALDPALLRLGKRLLAALVLVRLEIPLVHALRLASDTRPAAEAGVATAKKAGVTRTEEHTSELKSLMSHSYALFRSKK